MRPLAIAACAAALLLVGCVTDPEAVSDSLRMTIGAGTPVPAAGETLAVGTRNADAADDPEIWVDPRDPTRVVIFGTDKQAGLYAYGLDGQPFQFIPDGRLNNVDLRGGFPTPSGERVLVAASDRGRMGAALYLLDPDTLRTEPWGLAPLDLAEPYGLCIGRLGGRFVVIVNGSDGQVRQLEVRADLNGRPVAVEQRRFAVGSQTEGCVVDDEKGLLYIGEEASGIWRYALDPASDAGRVLIAAAPSEALKPDVEGLALMRDGPRTFLLASSQGDSAFAVWQVEGESPVYRGRFSVVGGAGADPVTGTDGLAAHGGTVGPFAEGLVVVQDDADSAGVEPNAARQAQNFKLVDWSAVKTMLGL